MPPPFVACSRCGAWLSGEPHARADGAAYCLGPCAPWARIACPLGPLLELGARVLARLDAEGLPRGGAQKIVAWLDREASRWPGPQPWVVARHAERARARLTRLAIWRPVPAPKRLWSGGMPSPPCGEGAGTNAEPLASSSDG
jgi:hypothetical protein